MSPVATVFPKKNSLITEELFEKLEKNHVRVLGGHLRKLVFCLMREIIKREIVIYRLKKLHKKMIGQDSQQKEG